jgi:hypothetical protein
MSDSVVIRINRSPDLASHIEALTNKQVLVGVTADKTQRQEGDGVTNATIAYLQDNGSPINNIPARPFMLPGLAAAEEKIKRIFKTGAEQILRGEQQSAEPVLLKVGLVLQAAIRGKINEGIPPPLAERTLQERIASGRATVGAQVELDRREQGLDPSTEFAKPLVHTGQLRNSITFVIRDTDHHD